MKRVHQVTLNASHFPSFHMFRVSVFSYPMKVVIKNSILSAVKLSGFRHVSTTAQLGSIGLYESHKMTQDPNERPPKIKVPSTLSEWKEGFSLIGKELTNAKNYLIEYWKVDKAWNCPAGMKDKVWDFSEPGILDNWAKTSDADHGIGYSKCTFTPSPNGRAMFSGNISTIVPQDGKVFRTGACAIRSPKAYKPLTKNCYYEWGGYNELVFRVRGDGRTYLVTLGHEGTVDVTFYDTYNYPLHTRGGPYWQITRIPFSKFVFGYKGHIQDKQTPLIPDRITSLGISCQDGIDGPFQLEIDYIALGVNGTHEEEFAYELYRGDKWIGDT